MYYIDQGVTCDNINRDMYYFTYAFTGMDSKRILFTLCHDLKIFLEITDQGHIYLLMQNFIISSKFFSRHLVFWQQNNRGILFV